MQHASCSHLQSIFCHNAWLGTTTTTHKKKWLGIQKLLGQKGYHLIWTTKQDWQGAQQHLSDWTEITGVEHSLIRVLRLQSEFFSRRWVHQKASEQESLCVFMTFSSYSHNSCAIHKCSISVKFWSQSVRSDQQKQRLHIFHVLDMQDDKLIKGTVGM